MSIAQYIRDAAVSRLAFAAGVEQGREQMDLDARTLSDEAPGLADRVVAELRSTEAVRAQGRLARERSRRLRADADSLRNQVRSYRDPHARAPNAAVSSGARRR